MAMSLPVSVKIWEVLIVPGLLLMLFVTKFLGTHCWGGSNYTCEVHDLVVWLVVLPTPLIVGAIFLLTLPTGVNRLSASTRWTMTVLYLAAFLVGRFYLYDNASFSRVAFIAVVLVAVLAALIELTLLDRRNAKVVLIVRLIVFSCAVASSLTIATYGDYYACGMCISDN